MKVLVLLAYPNEKGLCYATFLRIKKGLEEANHEIKVIDLYKENFDPVLHFDEEKRRRDMQFDPATEQYRNKILWAEHLIFIYPIWWSSMPAILKGFIDRVFATGFAYDFKGLLPVGHLKGKSAWIITTNDTPWIYSTFFQQDYGKILKKQCLSMCGIKKIKLFSLSSVKRSTLEKREKWLSFIEKLGLNGLKNN